MNAKYRAENVGSLLRPPELLEARSEYAKGRIDMTQLRHAEDQAILDSLQVQRDAGIDVFTDGEYRRRDFRTSFAESVDGFVEILNPINWKGPKPSDLEPEPAWSPGGHRSSGPATAALPSFPPDGCGDRSPTSGRRPRD